ncbi:TetR/AcrR family transcriptional regulator [Aliagarivorans marinus]|uniref:TetR/AcrR family transcriptional regulator n=1 Tax=Aliagarivorans marinus TaxID=561965 RepID=UPI0003F63A82|nr:TetR/AcrR family transcriptional regulator [Aliagarivorans marinus]
MKTKEKIVLVSLDMFNRLGERNVTTNHIAAELGISPGNLYYHFSNKQEIICSIFAQYEQQLRDSFRPQADQRLTLEQVTAYLDACFEIMWQFRFLYANLAELLARDEGMKARYHAIQEDLVEWVRAILVQLRDSRFLAGDDKTMEELADMVKFIVGAWIVYQSVQKDKGEIDKSTLYKGVLQVLVLLRPYFTETSRSTCDRLEQHYSELAFG